MPSSSSSSSSSGGGGNIFLTTDNLAFSLPLICVCLCYAYFKYIPLQYALSILGAVFVLYQIQSYSQARKDKKLTTLDESTIQDLAGQDDYEKEQALQAQKQKQRKAQNKLKDRLALEKKQARKQQNKKTKSTTDKDDDMDEDDAMLMFAKGSRNQTKKK